MYQPKKFSIGDEVYIIASGNHIRTGKIIKIRNPNWHSGLSDRQEILVETKYSGAGIKWWVNQESIIRKTSQNTNNLFKLYNIKKEKVSDQIRKLENSTEETIKKLNREKIQLFHDVVDDMKNNKAQGK